MPDVVVVIPGILGSVLEQRGREVWGLSLAAGCHAAISLGSSIRDLTLREDNGDPSSLIDDVEATRILPDLHIIPYLWKIDGYTRLSTALADAFEIRKGCNYFEFAYDWRRDNRVAARRLRALSDRWLYDWRRTSGNRDAKLIILAHSMGGLIARYFLEPLEAWRDTKALVTFGTPYRGSVNALRSLIEGIRKGPLGVFELSDLVRSLTSVFQLLPTYPCVALPSGENSYLVDAPDLPHVPRERLRDAAAFHAEIRAAVAAHLRDDRYQGERYRTLPVVGTQQDTLQSANIDPNGNIKFAYQHAAQDLKGDGTVPRISATPVELSNLGVETYVATCHASIQNSHGVVYHVCESLANLYLDLVSPNYRVAQQAATTVSLDVEDAYWDDEPVRIRLKAADTPSPALHLTISNIEQGIDAGYVNFSAGHEGWMQAELPPLAAGTYRASVVDSLRTNLVTDVFVVYHRA